MPAAPLRASGGQAGPPEARGCWAPVAPWRECLAALRRHPEADVRDAALDEVTAYE